ncbi:invasion protein CiaB [Helicobacter cholecystus]|uniref:invasion protein CiaB n=1 Tax=Helicobacter cholecystus TaxID=45498 RepID=UPI002739E1ED|nr:invasion protein CiaB [Helicobacter cholecystus]
MQRLWEYALREQNKLNELYEAIKGEDREELRGLREKLGLKRDAKVDFALCERIINLRVTPILQILKQEGRGDLRKEKREMIEYVSVLYARRFEKMIAFAKGILSEFEYELIKGVHQVGLGFNEWFIEWNDVLIEGINAQKFTQVEQDMLRASTDKAQGEVSGEKSYSIAQITQGEVEVIPYALAFAPQIQKITHALQNLLLALSPHSHPQKEQYLHYFKKLIASLNAKENLIQSWRQTDLAWLMIKAPLQVVHPFEYYEDIYRHSVAPEWDIRLKNPQEQSQKQTKIRVKEMFQTLSDQLNASETLKLEVLQRLEQTQFFDSLPLAFYGSLNNGLFSAQVIPNDEGMNKKIFAYTSRIWYSLKSKPKTRLEQEIFPEYFLSQYYADLGNEELWKSIYDISTNGHEYGHILWVDESSERIMNKRGEFKNIEEFKATCGGLVAYFMSKEKNLSEGLLREHIKRSVGLLAYRDNLEVLPYYCEALFHLSGAFECGVLCFKAGKLEIFENKSAQYWEWMRRIYIQLVSHYLQKREAGEFLYQFLSKEEGIYLPLQTQTKEFVKFYYERYLKIGQETL